MGLDSTMNKHSRGTDYVRGLGTKSEIEMVGTYTEEE